MKPYLFDFGSPPCRIGDKVAASYILQYLVHKKRTKTIHIVDYMPDSRESFPVVKYFPDICRYGYSKHSGLVPHGEYQQLDFHNLWISAPSLFQDTGYLPHMTTWGYKKDDYVSIHGLYDAPYNKGRNGKIEQVEQLYVKLKCAQIPCVIVPTDKSLSICEIIDNILRDSAIHVGFDTGITHLASAMRKEIVAIYGDDSNDVLTYEPLREQLKASHQWCSDPISDKYQKFVMVDNEFDIDMIAEYVIKKWKQMKG
jgi:hypothetical protein